MVDLGLALDRDASRSLPDQLEQQLRERLGRGELQPGAPLPSSRALAADLGTSRGIVVEAYDRLIRQGLLVARPGGAVRVSASLHTAPAASDGIAEFPGAPPAVTLDLHPASTPIGTLDRRAWGAAVREALRATGEADLASLDHAGLGALRAALAAQLARSRGVDRSP